jgi:hypothetical protein
MASQMPQAPAPLSGRASLSMLYTQSGRNKVGFNERRGFVTGRGPFQNQGPGAILTNIRRVSGVDAVGDEAHGIRSLLHAINGHESAF